MGSVLSADPAAPRAPTPRLRSGGVSREGSMMSSSPTDEITIPANPEVLEVHDARPVARKASWPALGVIARLQGRESRTRRAPDLLRPMRRDIVEVDPATS